MSCQMILPVHSPVVISVIRTDTAQWLRLPRPRYLALGDDVEYSVLRLTLSKAEQAKAQKIAIRAK